MSAPRVFKISGTGPTLFGRNGEGDPYYTDGEMDVASLVIDGARRTRPPEMLPTPPLIALKDRIGHGVSSSPNQQVLRPRLRSANMREDFESTDPLDWCLRLPVQYFVVAKRFGRGSWIRTNDLQYPKLPRYQAALYPGTQECGVDTRWQRRQQGASTTAQACARRRIHRKSHEKWARQWDDSADGPVSGWISAAIMPLEPGP
jgi:hypothetical protein